jgi:outer membrane autotransporter protein
MSPRQLLTAFTLLSAPLAMHACDGIWLQDVSGNWSTGFSCEPLVAGDTATFGTPPTGPVAVNVDVNPTITGLSFQNINPYTLAGSNVFTIAAAAMGGPSSIHVYSGHHTIVNMEVDLNNNTALTFTGDADSVLEVQTIIFDQAVSSLVCLGPGELLFRSTSATPAVAGMLINGTTTFDQDIIFTVDNTLPTTNTNSCELGLQGDVVLNSGVVTLINQGSIFGAGSPAFGTFADFSGNFTMNGGMFNIINEGAVSTNDTTHFTVGAGLEVDGLLTINGGTFKINTINIGPPTVGVAGAGVFAPSGIVVQGGRLINNGIITTGAIPSVVVGKNGTLEGNGTIGGGPQIPPLPSEVINNGTVIPGDPDSVPGTINFVGTYTQNASGTLQINILNSTSFGQVSTGTANIAGNLNVGGVSGMRVRPGDTFVIVNAPSGVNGTFSNVQMINHHSFIPMVFYFPDSVLLALNGGSYPVFHQSIFASTNHRNLRLEREMQKIQERFEKKAVVKTASKRTAASFSSNGFSVIPTNMTANQGSKEEIAFVRYQTLEKQHQLDQEIVSKYCEQYPANFYFGPIGTVGEVKTKRDQVGYNEWSAGAIAGFDYAFAHAGIGALIDYEYVHGDVKNHWGKFNIDQLHGSLYAVYAPKPVPELAFNGIIGGGYEWIDVQRNTGLTGGTKAHGKPRAIEFDALFGIEYTVSHHNFKFIPMVNIQYIFLDIDKYTEHKAGIFDLAVGSQRPKSLRSQLGAWISNTWQWQDLTFTPELNLGWQREYLDNNHSLKFSTINFPAPSGTQTVIGAGRNTFLAGLDLMFTLFGQYGIEASYDFEYNSLFHDQSFYLGFNVRF